MSDTLDPVVTRFNSVDASHGLEDSPAMSSPTPELTAPELETIATLSAAFEAARPDEPDLARASLGAPLRIVPGKRAIFGGKLGDLDAVFRFYIDKPEAHAKRDWDELQRTALYMQTGHLRVNAPLLHVPALGCVVVAHARGEPLMMKMWQEDTAARVAHMRPAADWLRAYTAPTEETRKLRISGWIERAEKGASRQPFSQMHAVEAAILTRMKEMAKVLEGQTWRMAISHGDYHPNNLLTDGPRLTGIDTGGSAQLPIYKDMARFLSHMGRRGLIASETRRFGVCAMGVKAFEDAFALNETERTVLLPFFLGVEALFRVEALFFSKGRLRRSKAFYDALLADLEKLPL